VAAATILAVVPTTTTLVKSTNKEEDCNMEEDDEFFNCNDSMLLEEQQEDLVAPYAASTPADLPPVVLSPPPPPLPRLPVAEVPPASPPPPATTTPITTTTATTTTAAATTSTTSTAPSTSTATSTGQEENPSSGNIAKGNRQRGPPVWQAQYDLMNASSCAAEKLPICLLGLTRLPTGKRNEDGTDRFDEFAAVYSQPFETKKEAMITCFQLVHEKLTPFGLDTIVSMDEKNIGKVALVKQNAKADEMHRKKDPTIPDEYPGETLLEKTKEMRAQQSIALAAEFGPIQNRPGVHSRWDFSRIIKFCCRRCYCISVLERNGPTRYCQVAEGRTHFYRAGTNNTSWVCYIHMTKIWFHDRNCTTLQYNKFTDLVYRRPTGFESTDPLQNTRTTKFDHNKVFKGAFDKLIHHIDSVYDNPLLANPPGMNINFGHKNYSLDDRRNNFMPSEDFQEQISFIDYHRALVRFTFTWICANDLCYQFTNEFSPCQYPPLPESENPDNSYGGIIRLCYSSVIHGGHNIDQTQKANGMRKKIYSPQEQNKRGVVHQMCHIDIPPIKKKDGKFYDCSFNEDTLATMCSGSIIIPLQDTAEIYIKNTDNWKTFEKGEAFYFPGDLPHGGVTLKYIAGDKPKWNLWLHLYVINQEHEFQWNKLTYYTTEDSYLPPEHIGMVDPRDLKGLKKKSIANLEMIAKREQVVKKKINTETVLDVHSLWNRLANKGKDEKEGSNIAVQQDK